MDFLEAKKEDEKKWDDFLIENSPQCFLQSFGWGNFQQNVGRKVFRYEAIEDGRIVAVAQVLEHNLPFGFRYWYIPRGPVVASDIGKEKAERTWGFMMENLRKRASRGKAVFLRMDPALENSKGYFLKDSGLMKIEGSVQPKDTLVLDLVLSEEEILSGMKQKTRYNIRLADKKGVTACFEDFSEEGFEKFWSLVRETSERDGIVSHNKEYYREMLRIIGAMKGALDIRLYFARYEGQVIASNVVLIFGPYAVYLHGASSNRFRNLMAPYLLQWKQIQDAKANGCRIYDFWGITIGNENPKWEGITRFKKGFGGKEASFVGVYDMPVNRCVYNLYIKLGRRG